MELAASREAEQIGRLELLAVGVLVALAIARVVATYHVFAQTFDEPAHLAAGIEWLDRGTFTYNRMHPPLARVVAAIGPFVAGVRSLGTPDVHIEGNDLLFGSGHARRILDLARLGILPFFAAAAIAVWLMGRRLYGREAGLVGTAIFTSLPPVLAQAGLVTTDMAVTAFVALTALAALSWLDRPDRRASIALAFAIAAAVLSKFSSILFIPACLVALLGTKLAIEPGTSADRLARWRRLELPTALVLGLTFLVIWAGYRFSVGSLNDIRLGFLAPPAIARARILPAPEFWQGLAITSGLDTSPTRAYLLGESGPGPWWYFFPVAIGVKTPIAALALALLGAGVACGLAVRGRAWRAAAPVATAVAILGSLLLVNLNMGVRHVLPIYAFLAPLAGLASTWLWRRTPRLPGRLLCVGLLGWHLVSSARAHPDYLAYFNEIAADRPEHFLINSDLDWTQDVARLADTLRARHIDTVSVELFGLTDRRLLAPVVVATEQLWHPTTGWVAISAWPRFTYRETRWLDAYTPVTRIGRSIWLYHIPAAATSEPLAPPRAGPGT